MTNSYDPVILPPVYSYGFSGGPSFDTRVIRMDGGGEQRIQVQQEPLWRWSATRDNVKAINGADPDGIRDWFLARRGALYGFLFIDPMDYTADETEVLGYGDGTTTVFAFRKTYQDPGQMSGRRFSRRIVPLTGTADAATASLLGVDVGADLSPSVAVGGDDTVAYTISQARGEVRFAVAPALGVPVTAGCYFCVPVRFDESTDQGLDISIDSFEGSSVSFDLVSIPFDDPAPVVVGGSPYGYHEQTLDSAGGVVDLDGREAFLYKITTVNASATLNEVFIPQAANYPTGGPHFKVHNDASSAGGITVKTNGGSSVGTIAAGEVGSIFISEASDGTRTPVLIVTGVS